MAEETPPPLQLHDDNTPFSSVPCVQPSPAAVETTSRCVLPSYWSFNPRLWLAQAEAALNSGKVRADTSRYDLLVAYLPPEVAQEVTDIILSPPATNRYETLKNAVLQGLTTSADRQLHQLLNGLQLGDNTPSQLLRRMKRFAGTAMSEDALRVKWLDLLLPCASRMCRMLKATSLDELATLAGELVGGSPAVIALDQRSRPLTPSSGISVDSASSSQLSDELSAMRTTLIQLLSISQQQQRILQSIATSLAKGNRDTRTRSASRTSRRASSPATPLNANPAWCWYLQTYGSDASRCKTPCTFNLSSGNH